MKTINTIIFLFSILVMSSCNKTSDNSTKRIVFDDGSLQVITSSANKKLETMSVLYGNSPAYQAALQGGGKHIAGAVYTFVTWQYAENPYWYGSKVNGKLLCVENIKVVDVGNGATQINYEIKSGKPQPVNGMQLSMQDRLAYILEHRPSVMP